MRWWPFLVVALLVVPAVSSQIGGPVREVSFHQFQELRFDDLDYVSTCDTGGFTSTSAGLEFTFVESMDGSGTQTDVPERSGHLTSGCATLRNSIPVAAGTDQVTVRFEADRMREDFDGPNAGAPLTQDLVIRDAGGREVQRRAIYAPEAASSDFQPFAFTAVGSFGGTVLLNWVFADPGLSPQTPVNPASGQDFGGTVRNVVIEAVAPARQDQVRAEAEDLRDGTRLTAQHRVNVQVPEFTDLGTALRVRVAGSLDLVHVIAPDGRVLASPTTFEGELLGFDHDDVVVGLHAEHTQAVVPQSLVEKHGAGGYTFVFEESHGLEVSRALVPFSIILLITPLPFAVLAWVESRAFRREAFGGYARSARNLQYGVGLVFLYYVAVVASAAVGGRLDLMAIMPLPLEGILLYVQLALAGIAFTALWLVARELYLLVKPRPAAVLDDAF